MNVYNLYLGFMLMIIGIIGLLQDTRMSKNTSSTVYNRSISIHSYLDASGIFRWNG